MKKLQFESNGSKWLLIDSERNTYCHNSVMIKTKLNISLGVFLKGITDKQADSVVESTIVDFIDKKIYRDYGGKNTNEVYCDRLTAIQSLHSLLKSKGIHLYGNPYQSDWDDLCIWGHGDFSKDGKTSFDIYKEAEEKTFYNPILFKIL